MVLRSIPAGWFFVVATTALLTAVGLDAQRRPTTVERRAAVVRASDDYRWGEGFAASPEGAKEAARHDLVTRIRALVTSTIDHQQTETDSGLTSRFSSRVISWSAMQLWGLEYLELPRSDDHYGYLAFVSEVALLASMELQRTNIRTMAKQATDAAARGRLDEALRLNYWAYLLTHTVDTVTVTLPGVQLSDPRQAFLQNISRMVGQIRFQAEPAVVDRGRIGVALKVTYEGQPATLDLWLYTGVGMDFPHVSGGHGYIELDWDAEALSAREQELQVRLLYAYEGRMHSFPEIEALHEMLGQQELDTWVRVPVVFPFVKEGAPINSAIYPASPSTVPEVLWRAPLPVRSLAAQTETEAFMKALQIYVRNGRLSYHHDRPEPRVTLAGSQELYVAVATEDRVLGVFLVEEEGYLEVLRQVRLASLQRPEFAGAHKVWLLATQP